MIQINRAYIKLISTYVFKDSIGIEIYKYIYIYHIMKLESFNPRISMDCYI